MSAPVPPQTVDVLIVGAGPAGAMAALALVKCGVRNIKIVDIAPRKTAGYAGGIMPRTIEVFKSYGLLDKLYSEGACPVYRIATYTYDKTSDCPKLVSRFPAVAEPTARYPFILESSQPIIEGTMLEAVAAEGIDVERLYSPIKLDVSSDEAVLGDPTAYPITAYLQSPELNRESQVVRARFIVGADGAHSYVRKTVGIEMEGAQTDQVWGAVDFIPSPESDFPDWRNVGTIIGGGVSVFLIPHPGGSVRLYVELSAEKDVLDPATGRVDMARFSAKRLLAITKKAFHPYIIEPSSMEDVSWWTVYGVGQRVASAFSVHERVFIAGDAGHTHSPDAGQGLNTSVNDSHNLGWKLAYVLKGLAPLSLLKTYESERRTFALKLIAFDRWYAEGFSSAARAKLQGDSNVEMPMPIDAFVAHSSLTSGCGIHYAPSLVVEGKSVIGSDLLVVGKRLPPQTLYYSADHAPVDIQDFCPSDGRFKLFVFVGNLATREDKARLGALADGIKGVLHVLPQDVVSIVTVIKNLGGAFTYRDVPAFLRPRWTSVIEDTHNFEDIGRAYGAFGIGDEGALIVVRPDGYVGTVTRTVLS
ncbi:unnamed protein product [Peniophora sp. CBMAI 1063]|nr:unnamed protein product [Peniophora sp. CBMAI 1063]